MKYLYMGANLEQKTVVTPLLQMFRTCLGTELKTHEYCDITDTVTKKMTTSTLEAKPAKTLFNMANAGKRQAKI